MAKGKSLSEHEVSAILANELKNSYGYFDTELVEDRKKANEYYFGEAFGNEQEGRSQVVSTDVADTVESILPSLLRIFTASDNIVKVDPVTQEDVQVAKQASDYLNHIFNKDNDGFTTLYSMFKDALLHKNGVVKVYWDTSEKVNQETYERLSDAEFTMLMDEEGVHAKEHTEYNDPAFKEQKANMKKQLNEAGDQISADLMEQQLDEIPIPKLHDVIITRTETFGKVRFEAIPPEEFLIQRRAKSLDDAHFLCHRTTKTRSELIEMGFDFDTVSGLAGETTQR